ncbi:hypothetical protein EES46_09945 [Streptomyces sp. ADI98-10]|nr:hypothetical protein EES46_09945 [Streptomyces sp. ADI98-10]
MRGGHGGQGLGSGAFQGAQPVEVLGDGVQPLVRGRAPPQDLVQHPAAGRVVLGEGVVELLAQPERPRQLVLRPGDRLGEGLRRLLAELGGGEAEFLLAGAHRVIRVHQHLLGLRVQLRQRRRRLRRTARPRAPAPAGRRRGGAGRRAPSAPGVRVEADRADAGGDGHRQDEVADAGRAGVARSGVGGARGDGGGGHRASRPYGGVAVGRTDRGPRPVVLPQRGLDRGARHVPQLSVGERGARIDGIGVLPVVGGDGEQHVVLAQTVAVGGLVAPGLPGPAGEVTYVHHEELDALVVVQPVESVLHLPRPVAQGPHPVGDLPVPGQLDGVVGAGGRGGGEHQPAHGGQHGEQPGDRTGGPSPAGCGTPDPWQSRRCHLCEAMCAF